MSSSREKRVGFRNVIALGFVSFFTDVSTEMVLSLIPVFIVYELGASRGILGIIEGLAESLSYALRLVSGVISDKLRRRKAIIFLGYAISSIAKPLFFLAHTWIDALVIRVMDRIGKGIRTSPRDALLSESVKDRELGKAFGLHRSLDQAGAILGPFLSLVLLPLIGMRRIFLLSFIPAALALVILWAFVVEAVWRPKASVKVLRGARSLLRGKFLVLLGAVTIFYMGAFNYSFILVRAAELGIPVALIPLVYMVINIMHTAIGLPAGFLADRVGREVMLALGYAFFSATSLSLILIRETPLYAFIAALMFGIYAGIVDTIQRALLPKYVPSDMRGTAYGIYYITIGFASLVGNSVVGYLWDVLSYRVAFAYSLLLSVIAIGAVLTSLKS
ncbi:MAG: hypothetical protein DRJ51_02190 [Thermoprotei archaeon]|mgnify:CR=1 FL=1|nr:MAG: hypothetical protein DRJ51_02190 [Thermoprotei archaeon]